MLFGPSSSKVDSLVFTLRHPHLLAHDEVPALDDLRLFSSGGGSEILEWDVAAGTVKVILHRCLLLVRQSDILAHREI